MLRLSLAAGALMLAGSTLAVLANPVPPAGAKPPAAAGENRAAFQAFLDGLWPEAQAVGVSRATFERALRGLTPDPKVSAQTRTQSEFVRPIWDYLAGAVTATRIAKGQALAREWAGVLDSVERTYGVPRAVVLAVWGVETNYGGFTGGIPTIRALATLAFERYRGDMFRRELLKALQILERDGMAPEDLRGSWAGAMGHTQFMPSSFMNFAVDGDGDGRRDIWTSVPDALASTANYLRQQGWTPGVPWGVEVAIPQGFNYRTVRASLSAWAAQGFRRADGSPLPRGGAEAALFLPAGLRGPALLVTANFDVIRTYNSSDSYALSVGLLSDRIAGGGPLLSAWPVGEPMLPLVDRQELQRRLAALGLYDGEVTGRLGPRTRDAVRQFQLSRGMPADGYASAEVLGALRGSR